MADAQFRTFQTVKRYERSLARHGQWIRWMRGVTCPCIQQNTGQSDPHCNLCRGRGKLYSSPGSFHILDEIVRHDRLGRIYPRTGTIVSGSAYAAHKGKPLALASDQPPDGSYIQLAAPFPSRHSVIRMSYDISMELSITNENPDVVGTRTLRTRSTRFDDRGKSFEGSIVSVSRVHNADKDEDYAVVDAVKEYIYLHDMGTWSKGDKLEVDYVYLKPFDFMLSGVTHRMRYEQPYVLEEADAILVTPYWAKPGPDDVFTALAQEPIGRAVVDPTITTGNDVVSAYFDLSRLNIVVDRDGVYHEVGKAVEIYGRNELRWNSPKPKVPYTAQFTYHPTMTALSSMHSLRNAENKSFVNRTSVKMMDHANDKVVF